MRFAALAAVVPSLARNSTVWPPRWEKADHDVKVLKGRRRGRPAMGSAPADVVAVRLAPEMRSAIEARAAAEDTTTSEIIREALRRFL